MDPATPSRDESEPRWPGQLAAIDMGSNSFRLEIGQLLGERYRRIDYLKETVRLGGGLDAAGFLGDDAATRGLECLARFARRLEALPRRTRCARSQPRQALREASNRNAFLAARADDVLGRPIEIISGREEARLIFSPAWRGCSPLGPVAAPRHVPTSAAARPR